MATPPCRLCSSSSTYSCSCENPPVPCCHACSYVHHETPGTHNWSMLERFAAKNTSCEMCEERTAEIVCCCKFPVTSLCMQCRGDHFLKNSMKMHIMQPIENSELIKSLEDIERARRVLENKDRIEEYLNKNKASATKLKDEVTRCAEQMIVRINSAKEETLKEIKEVESAIEEKSRTLRQEVEAHLFGMKVQSLDELVKEAFDSSKHFACADILRGELHKEGQLVPRLATLYIPPLIHRSASDHHQVSQHQSRQYPSYDYRNPQVFTQPMQSQSYGNVHGSFPAKPQTIPSHPVQPQDYQWPPQEYPNPGGYALPPQYPGDAMRLNSIVPAQTSQYQEIPSVQGGEPAGSENLSRSTESNHFEITEEMRSNVHAPCREDFHNRTPEIPIAIGRHRLPIESLQGEFKWNELMVRKMQFLSVKYSSWRRSRGDGNCFYRCVGVLLCEHYCRPDTPIAEVTTIYKTMIEQSLHFRVMSSSPEIMSKIKMWQRLVKDICNTRTNGENAFQRLQYFLQKPKFDKAIIVAIRNYTASYIRIHANDPGVSEFLPEGPEPVIREIMEYGTEAEGIALMFAAQAFSIILRILTVNNKSGQTSETTYGPAIGGWYPSMHLLHLPGHYNYLVPRAWDVTDRYDFTSNTYSPVPTQTVVDYEEYVPPM